MASVRDKIEHAYHRAYAQAVAEHLETFHDNTYVSLTPQKLYAYHKAATSQLAIVRELRDLYE